MTTSVSPISLGKRITASIVPAFKLDQVEFEELKVDLEWLFAAADHYLKICRAEISRDEPLTIPLPPEVERVAAAQPHIGLLATLDDAILLPIWEMKLDLTILKPIEYHWDSLSFLLDREAQRGQSGRDDLNLQKEIRAHRVEIIRFVVMLADLITRAYGVRISSPHELVTRVEAG